MTYTTARQSILGRPLWIHVPLFYALSASATPIKPSGHWLDESGVRIEAHAAGILLNPKDGRYYWYGESKKVRAPNDRGGVNCYSSAGIAGPWKWEGRVLKQDDITVANISGPWIVERPKVLYNNATEKFVMWFHLDIPATWDPQSFLKLGASHGKLEKYIYHHAAVAHADHAAGPFTFSGAVLPDGLPSLDMNLFQDPLDGQAYLLRDVNHRFIGISRLSPDYLSTTGIISTIPTSEGMAMFRLPNGTYYVLSSHLTGWDPNPMIAWRSNITQLDGAGWEDLGNPTGDETSFFSQPTSVMQYTPQNGDPYFVYVGDNWVHCSDSTSVNTSVTLPDACYVWLPIRLDVDGSETPIEIKYQKEWDLEDPFKAVETQGGPSLKRRSQVKRSKRPLGFLWPW